MIHIELNRDVFEYDIRSLVKAFYPEEKLIVTKGESIEKMEITFKLRVCYNPENITISMEDKNQVFIQEEASAQRVWIESEDLDECRNYKNIVKRLLYLILEKYSKKTLLWGTLTGIRPTKIPMGLLEKGTQDHLIKAYMEKEYLCSSDKADLCIEIAKREKEILQAIDYKNGYSLYIGIPFCPSTCLYCSFTSYSIEKYKDYVEDYLVALFKEIDYAAASFRDRKLISIYLGGGTPTTLGPEQLERLLLKIRTSFSLENVRELTVEAGRPDSITEEKLVVLKKQGVTRISINPQTMNLRTLEVIGRKHTVDQINEAFQMARETGHNNINMDIILSLPGEGCKEVLHTLEEINKLEPESLTVHTLAIKRAAGLTIYKDQYKGTMVGDAKEMLSIAREYAQTAGYVPYYLYRQKNMADNLENIGYAKKGKEGIYNILIMEEKHTIMALGAGASSKFVFLDEERIERSENVKSVKDYIVRIEDMIQRKKRWIERD